MGKNFKKSWVLFCLSDKYDQSSPDNEWSCNEIKDISDSINSVWNLSLKLFAPGDPHDYHSKETIDYFKSNIKDFIILKMFFEKLVENECSIVVF